MPGIELQWTYEHGVSYWLAVDLWRRNCGLGLRNCADVVFACFQQMDTLPAYYGLASRLVPPSVSEPWGLVVNEAMAAGAASARSVAPLRICTGTLGGQA